MPVKAYFPDRIITWAKDQSNNQVPAVIPMYYEVKKVATNQVFLKHFNTEGAYFGANNHPAEFDMMLDAGDYEVTLRCLHRNRLLVQAFVMRGDTADSNSSAQMQVYKELIAGMEAKFTFTVVEYNPTGTQYYKLNWNCWFENATTHQFSTKNPTPPNGGTLGSLTESQYYMQDTFQISLNDPTLTWLNVNVPTGMLSGIETKRATMPNTPTIAIVNPNVNGGNPQQVTNPFYRNVSGPAIPVILAPTSGKMAIGGTISGTTTDYTNTIVVLRNGVEIATIAPTQSLGSNGSWSYKPSTPQIYTFKARKNSVDSAASDPVQITIACNISNNQNILTWNQNGQFLRAKTFDGGISYYLCKIISESPLTFEMRGIEFLDRSDVTAIGGVILPELKACFANSETGNGGLNYDKNFITPANYNKVGDTYVAITAAVPTAPVPASGSGTVGTDIEGTANQAGVILVFKDAVQLTTTNIVTSGATNAWTYNPIQAGKYTFKLTNDNGTSPLSIEVNVAPVVEVTTRTFRARGVNYCDIDPANIEAGYSTGSAADVTNWVDGIVITTTLLVTPGTKGYLRDKTDHSKVTEGVLLIPQT